MDIRVTTPNRARAKDSGIHLPFVRRPVPEYHSAFAIPKCTDPEQAEKYPATHSKTNCLIHPRYPSTSAHTQWHEARERYATAEPGTDHAEQARQLERVLKFVTATNPPDAPRPKTVAEPVRVSVPAITAVAGISLWLVLTALILLW